MCVCVCVCTHAHPHTTHPHTNTPTHNIEKARTSLRKSIIAVSFPIHAAKAAAEIVSHHQCDSKLPLQSLTADNVEKFLIHAEEVAARKKKMRESEANLQQDKATSAVATVVRGLAQYALGTRSTGNGYWHLRTR